MVEETLDEHIINFDQLIDDISDVHRTIERLEDGKQGVGGAVREGDFILADDLLELVQEQVGERGWIPLSNSWQMIVGN